MQIDGPYDSSFLEKVKTCPSEDDGSIEYAVAKVILLIVSASLVVFEGNKLHALT